MSPQITLPTIRTPSKTSAHDEATSLAAKLFHKTLTNNVPFAIVSIVNVPDASGGNARTPFERMHSANFTARADWRDDGKGDHGQGDRWPWCRTHGVCANVVIGVDSSPFRPCWSLLHPWILRGVVVHARATAIDGYGAQFVMPGLVAVDLAQPVLGAVL